MENPVLYSLNTHRREALLCLIASQSSELTTKQIAEMDDCPYEDLTGVYCALKSLHSKGYLIKSDVRAGGRNSRHASNKWQVSTEGRKALQQVRNYMYSLLKIE